jgi:DNA-binding transcriptional regulator YhcF (GntR family)
MHLIWRLDKNRGICPQICEQLCARIVAKEFLPGQRLLSVREVALAAGVNPNTVQRAFEQLETQGVLRSERGSGWFVTEDIGCAQALYQAMVEQKCRQFFLEMADLGMTPDAVKNLVKEWENE